MSGLGNAPTMMSLARTRRSGSPFSWRRAGALAPASVLLLILLLSLIGPSFSPYDPLNVEMSQRLRGPSAMHWLGTDALGRDVATRLLLGGRVSLLIGAAVAAMSTVLGVTVGLIAAWSRLADAVLMRIMDGLMAIPGILLAIALSAIMQGGIVTVIVAVTVIEIPRMARLTRSTAATLRHQPFVEAARLAGVPLGRMLGVHVMPNIAGPIAVQAAFISASAILIEAYLSFLGAGIPPEIPSWGNMIAEGRTQVQIAFGVVLYPALALAVTVLTVNLLGDQLRDRLDPRSRGRQP